MSRRTRSHPHPLRPAPGTDPDGNCRSHRRLAPARLALLALATAGWLGHAVLAQAQPGQGKASSPDEPAAAIPEGSTAGKPLGSDSTLAEWKQATAGERSRVAVAIARTRLGADAPKFDVARMAMEITGCLSATAKDGRLAEWKVAPAAETCLTAPELPAP